MLSVLLFVALSAFLFWATQRHHGYDQAVNYGKKAGLSVRALVLISMPGSLVFTAINLVTSLMELDMKLSSALIRGNLQGYRAFLGDCLQVVLLGQVGEAKRGLLPTLRTES